jgi:hypothetical protein
MTTFPISTEQAKHGSPEMSCPNLLSGRPKTNVGRPRPSMTRRRVQTPRVRLGYRPEQPSRAGTSRGPRARRAPLLGSHALRGERTHPHTLLLHEPSISYGLPKISIHFFFFLPSLSLQPWRRRREEKIFSHCNRSKRGGFPLPKWRRP